MDFDGVLLFIVFSVWAVLALIYAAVPALSMPGAAPVWAGGAVVFLVIELLRWWRRR